MKFDSVLVANRGEIAVRVIRTARRLGLRTVAVYSDADAHALHVAQADEALRIGRSPAAESYLDQAAILRAARDARSGAIHPGYGFLSENASFAERVLAAGLTWVGPPPEAMRALGDKAHAKALAQATEVPVLPGYHGDDQSNDVLRREAERIGYPLLIKASAGGGGRGMRIVTSAEDLEGSLEAARRESLAAFGSDRVLLERYLERPRHVEVQIVGDSRGHLVHLGERECSIQRRHQKLIEESPSPAVDAELRQRMGNAALRLARAAGYANAGTVEFLVDGNGDFAFLEVNARLQVEHPVTELITGVDLVELQFRVASGEPLGLSQADVALNGHAIEARVIAEDPQAGFLPSSGTVTRFVQPGAVRVDTWIRDDTRVSPYYDSLLAKVIAHGATREEAVDKLAHALRKMRIEGVRDNIDLLLATLEVPAFREGDLDTGFLDGHSVVRSAADLPSEALAAVVAPDYLVASRREPDPWSATSGWRTGRVDQPAMWLRAGRAHAASVSGTLGQNAVDVVVGGASHRVRLLSMDPAGSARVSVDGRAASVMGETNWRVVEWNDRTFRLERAGPVSLEDTAGDRGERAGPGTLGAPMPARVVKVLVTPGQSVRQAQPLVVLEAMKMEHVVEAPHAGVVSDVCVNVGDQVASGARLLTLDDVE